jgi:hypothetical protein
MKIFLCHLPILIFHFPLLLKSDPDTDPDPGFRIPFSSTPAVSTVSRSQSRAGGLPKGELEISGKAIAVD